MKKRMEKELEICGGQFKESFVILGSRSATSLGRKTDTDFTSVDIHNKTTKTITRLNFVSYLVHEIVVSARFQDKMVLAMVFMHCNSVPVIFCAIIWHHHVFTEPSISLFRCCLISGI